jgi:hypothetical protein
MSTDPQETNPLQLGYSLANLGEVLFGCLDAISAKSLVEVGPYRGELTAELLEWAAAAGARVSAIEPDPPSELLELSAAHPELELIRQTSHEALPNLGSVPDAIVIDGDHNHHTVAEELRLIGESSPGPVLPLLMFHDIGWPHARRDTYYAPERIPEESRQPLAHNTWLRPGNPGVAEAGIPYTWAAEREGGEGNGVLTAIEDFIETLEGLRLAVIPAFFGFGVLWHQNAPWSDAVAKVVAPLDNNPVVARLEANRVAHLAAEFATAHELALEKARSGRQAELLGRLGDSRAFALAERLSRLRQGGQPRFSREEVERVLEDDDQGPAA